MKKFFRFLAFVPMLFPLSLHAQGIGEDEGFKLPGYMDNVVPPSPTAAQIVKYADTPVLYSLGLADITIPIYTIKTRELELPITLTYHASGIRVDEIPGPVGLGWSLNAGGAITKTVVGLVDEDPQRNSSSPHRIYSRGLLTPDNPEEKASEHMVTYLDGVIHNKEDSYYDKYNYSYNGNTGSFMLAHSPEGSWTDYVLKQTTLNDDAIDFDGYSSGRIIDPYGNKYLFGATEQLKFTPHQDDTSDPLFGSTGYNTTSSWYLTQMESYSGLDRIMLEYLTSDEEWVKETVSHSRTFSYNEYGNGAWTKGLPERAITKMAYSNMKFVKKIVFEGGSVVFDYERQPTTRIGHGIGLDYPDNTNIPHRLAKISIVENGDTVKVFTMNHSTFGDNRIMLNSINVEKPKTVGGKTLYDSYTFDYYDKTASISAHAQDLFGYYNGMDSNTNLCHRRLFEWFDDESQKRMHSIDHAVRYTLSEIVTRRGDSKKTKTRYEYESNRHTYDEDAFYGAWGEDIISEVNIGLRIKSIETYDGNICVKRRAFEYAESDCTIDFTKIRRSHYFTRSQNYSSAGITRALAFSNTSVLPGASPESAKIYYEEVNEYIADGRNPADVVRVKYLYDCADSKAERITIEESWSNPFKIYGYGTEPDYTVSNPYPNVLRPPYHYILIPYTIYSHREPHDGANAMEIQFYFRGKTPTFSNLTNKIIYKTQGDDYVKVEEEVNTYRKFNTELIRTGLYVKDLMSGGMMITGGASAPSGAPGGGPSNAPGYGNGSGISDTTSSGGGGLSNGDNSRMEFWHGKKRIERLPNDCYYFDVEEEVSTWKLVSSKRIKYFDGDIPVSDTAPIGGEVYNPEFGGLNGSGPIGSGSDYFELIDDGYTLNPFIRPSKTETTQYGYHMSSASVLSTFQPKYVEQHVDGDVYRREYKYPSDFASNGNVYKEMDDANNHYTVVEESVSRSTADDAMPVLANRISIRTHFDTVVVYKRNRLFPSRAIKPSSRTRSVNNVQTHAYTIHNHDRYGNPACVSVNGMAPTCYIWSYGGKHLVAEIKNATYAELTAKISRSRLRDITANMNPSEDIITRLNSLRTSLPGAMVTVYEYKPMVGISAITDPSGRKTTFSYDAAGRLSTVKDPDGNLIETYEYKNF